MKMSVLNQTRQLLTACSLLLLITLKMEGQTTTTTFTFKHATLSDALKRLKKERRLQLAVNNTILRGYYIDSLTITGNTTKELLTQLLNGFPFGFSFGQHDEKEQISIFSLSTSTPIAIRGQVFNEENEPLPGASIFADTPQATQADNNGRFLLHAQYDTLRISISMIGYHSLDTFIVFRKTNRFRLRCKHDELPVAHTIGMFPGDLMESPAQPVEAKDSSDDCPLTSVSDVLSDETGVLIRRISGLPSLSQAIELQGHHKPDLGTAGRISLSPLVIVDGIPWTVDNTTQSLLFNTVSPIGNISVGMDRQATLNINDIESLQLLKDAISTAPYGARGANGVILITTRKASYKKEPWLKIDLYQGFSATTNAIGLLDNEGYIAMRLAAYQKAGVPAEDFDITGWDHARNTNFPRAIFGGITGKTVVNLSGSWRYKKLSGHHSAGVNRERYPLPVKTGNDWYTTYSNIDYRLGSATINLSVMGGMGNTTLPFFDPLPSQYFSPNAPVEKQGGLLLVPDSLSRLLNPFGWQFAPYKAFTANLLTSLLCSWHPAKRLNLSLRVGWSGQQTIEKAAIPEAALPGITSDPASAHFSSHVQRNWEVSPQADYTLLLHLFKLQLSIGATFQSTRTMIQFADSAYTNDGELWNNFNRSVAYRPANPIHYRYAGGYFGFTLSFRKRLTLQANGRIDASSRFSAQNSTGTFGSVGVAYQLLRKDSVNDKRAIFNWIKLRATGGTTGSDGISDYLYLSRWTAGGANTTYAGQPVLTPQTSYRSDVRWMTMVKWNAGIDCKLFKHLNLTVNYYHNLIRNQFISIALPGQTGTSTGADFDVPVRVLNTGIEWSLRSTFTLTSRMSGSITWAFTRPWNKLLSSPDAFLDLVPDHPLTTRRLYTFLGKDANNNFQVKDYNGDGKITRQDDAKELKDREVRNYWSCSIGLERNRLSFRIRVDGRSQPQFSQLYRDYADSYPGSNLNGYLANKPAGTLNWDGPLSLYQSPSVRPSAEQQRGVQWMLGSNVSLEPVFSMTIRQIDLRYELPQRLANKISAKSVQLYLLAKDLYTLSSYKGGNPFLADPTGIPMIATAGIGANITF